MDKFLKYFLIVSLCSLSCGQSNDYYQQNWLNLFRESRRWLKNNSYYYMKTIESSELRRNVSAVCANKLIKMIDKIDHEEWAAKMVDANGHLPSGILSGTVTDLGDFDQCIAISSKSDKIEGKYCIVTVKPKRERTYHPIGLNDSLFGSKWFVKEVNEWLELDNQIAFANGICVPSDCKPREVEALLSQVEIAFVMIVIGSMVELISSRNQSVLNVLRCFSVFRNIRILFKISSLNSNREYRLQFIHGFRVLGTIWVIVAHTSGMVLVSILAKVSPFARYPEDAIANSKSVLAQYVMNASLAVQIFFVMSGMLTVYSTLSKKRLEISFFSFVLLRWLRFTPPLLGMLCFTVCLQHLGSGPLFHRDFIEPYVRPCYDNSWAHFLYIINWFDLREMCGIHTWYLSADFQLHIISFVVIYFFYKNQSISYWFSYCMIGLGATIPILIVWFTSFGIPRVDVLFKPKYVVPGKETTLFFFGTHMHLISFFSGTILGCALLNRRFIAISKMTNRIIWGVVIFLIVTLPALSYPVLQGDTHPVNQTVGNSVMVAIMLLIWSLCMSWIIYNCAINRGGVLSKILSAKFLQPLSRLSFSAYLSHLMLIWFNVHHIRYPIAINVVSLVQYFCTILVETFLTALVLYLTFEAPFVNLIKMVFMGRSRDSKSETQSNEENNNFSNDSQNRINIQLKNQRNGDF